MDTGPAMNQLGHPGSHMEFPYWAIENGAYSQGISHPPQLNNYQDHLGPKPALLPRPDIHPGEWINDWRDRVSTSSSAMINYGLRDDDEERQVDERIRSEERIRIEDRIRDDANDRRESR